MYLIFQVASTKGMKRSVETSHLFKIRAKDIVPERTELMVKVN
jgi:mevalonate pyrophosphate decarboxylase